MSARASQLFVVAVALIVVTSQSLFTVNETQWALRTRFREIIQSDYPPGLFVKLPFLDSITRFDRRVLTLNYQNENFLTSENRGVLVTFYVKFRIKDPAQYYRSTGGNEQTAGQRVGDIVKDGIKNAVAQRTLEQIVTAERAAFTGDMFERASATLTQLGIELVDVRVQTIDLPEDVAARVYDSMKQSFERLAKQQRGEGEKDSLRIRADADRRRIEILADAQRESLRLRGEGDAAAAEIYNRAYTRNPEFYAFYRSLQAYKNTLGKEGDILVVTPDSEFFKYLNSPSGAR
ncbi:MAG: protease modulator HflC [Steroidobacteraceae bacterium]|nr:protease modulator HflC [Steroidobacteraceae bacterium]MDW8260389.1 protease modulator HflC [Gammaproteobacteria bacterium]